MKEIISKEWSIVSGKITLLRPCWADNFTKADHVIPDWMVKGFTPGGIETAVRLGIKPGFADIGFSLSDFILGLLSPF